MIICIGIAVFDIIFDTNKPIEENKKNQAQGLRFNIGGNGINVAKVLNYYKAPVKFVGAIGQDSFGQIIYNELTTLGIRVSPDFGTSSIETPVSVIVNNTIQNSRTILNYKTINQLPMIKLDERVSLIYADGRYPEYIAQYRKYFTTIPIVWDWERITHYKDNKSLVREQDILICSEDFINELLEKQENTEQEIVNFLYRELFFHSIIITKGAKGYAWSTNSDNNLISIPAIKVNAIDTNGAGDVFHALFIYYYSNGFNISKSLESANILTSQFVSRKGFLEALPIVTDTFW